MASLSSVSPSSRGSRSHDRPQELAFRALVRTLGLVERVMQPYFARFGISGTKWGALRTLHRAESNGEGGLRMTELSDRLLVRPPSVTGVVDRLEREGLVERDPAPDDLRAKRVRLTAKGRRLVEQVMAVHADQIDRVLGGLSAAEQAELHRLLDRVSSHLDGLLATQETAAGEN